MTKTEAAEQWLREYLLKRENYRDNSVKIKLAGKKAGHAERTLKRASYNLMVTHRRASTVPSTTWWELPSWELPQEERERRAKAKRAAQEAEPVRAANPFK